MKNAKIVGLLLLLLLATSASAQLQDNHWILSQTDVSFTSTTPAANVVAGNPATDNYGLATISDDAGNLLFYTDGVKVWNKNHAVMTNGNALGYSKAINIVIVPNPSNKYQYYIVRSENFSCLCGGITPSYYAYSIVEFNAANPLGNVLTINSGVYDYIENAYSILLESTFGPIHNSLYIGPLTVAKNASEDGYWIIGQDSNTIVSYKIDASGLNPAPVISTFTNAQIYSPGTYDSSYGLSGVEGIDFRITPNNNRLIGLQYSKADFLRPNGDRDNDYVVRVDKFYKLDFNSSTGVFNNYLFLFNDASTTGFEISNNSNLIYSIRFPKPYPNITFSKGEIVVRDLNNLSAGERTLNLSGTTTLTSMFTNLQKDRNGNLLISSVNASNDRNLYIHKVENQDSYLASSVLSNYVYMNGKKIDEMPQLVPTIAVVCPSILLVTSNVSVGEDLRQASSHITASNVISSGAIANYHAGSSVVLANGFHAISNSKFRGYIEGCIRIVGKMPAAGDIPQEKESTLIYNDMTLFPNPSDSKVTLSVSNQLMISIKITKLTDARVLVDQKLNGINEFVYDFSVFDKGLYIIAVETSDGKLHYGKLIRK